VRWWGAQVDFRYLLLQSLRQLISLKAASARAGAAGAGGDLMGGHTAPVMALLMKQCDSEEESVRSLVAECLGRLALIAPVEVLPKLKELVGSARPETRATAVNALKFTITDHAPVAELAGCIEDFLRLLTDESILVRKAALTTLNSATHTKAALVRPALGTDWLLPCLYGETAYKKELVRTVNLGPFQHKVDDGAELRKLALACMDTLLDRAGDRLDMPIFLTHVQARLSDELDDIIQAAYQVLAKLAVRDPACVREVLDTLSEPLGAVLNKKHKESASPQDIERHNELLRTAMVTVVALRRMHDANTCHKFAAMVDAISQDAKLRALLEAVSSEGDASSAIQP
jgi:cullin-associated NEDD8-dissociated protein 1